MKKLLGYLITAAIFFLIGTLVADTKVADVARSAARSAKSAAIEVVANAADIETRMVVLAENPELIKRISEGGAFGGENSLSAAQNMFGRTEDAIEDVRNKTRVVEVGDRAAGGKARGAFLGDGGTVRHRTSLEIQRGGLKRLRDAPHHGSAGLAAGARLG